MGPELRAFIEHVDACTASAVVESRPLATRPIVSLDSLRSWLTVERARSLLLYVESTPSYEDAVRTSHLAVFSVLLSINKGTHISTFIRHDHMADVGLPFHSCDAWPEAVQYIFDEFYKAQWKFCPKRLISRQLHDIWLDKNIVVPFKEKRILKEGEDSVIFKVELFNEYNHLITDELNIPPTNVFILKSSRSDYAKLHNNEVEAYRTLLSFASGQDAMQHMARFYGSWRQGEHCNILREYVGGGTLTSYFNRTEPPTTMDDILEFWKNFIQFIKPIACIHRLPNPQDRHSFKVGLHNDIKPDNILVSEQEGTIPYRVQFKLADLGLAGFAVAEDPGEIQLRDVHGTNMYSAPEYFLGETDRSMQQSIIKQAHSPKDIWALACIISEAAVWSVFGRRGLIGYGQRRVEAATAIPALKDIGHSGFFHDTTKLLAVVEEVHKEVVQGRRANIDSIVGQVLLTVGRMMDQDPTKRPDAWTVYEDLTRAVNQATPPAPNPTMQLLKAYGYSQHEMRGDSVQGPGNAPSSEMGILGDSSPGFSDALKLDIDVSSSRSFMAAPGDSEEEPAYIHQLTQKCRDKLRSFTQSKVLMENHWAGNRLSDFNLWDASIGASARPPNSLDHRLQGDLMAREVLSDALKALFEWSAKCLQLCVVAKPDLEETRPRTDGILTTDTSNTEALDQDEPPITLVEGRTYVEELLTSLVEMGTAIRQAGTASRLRQADRSLREDVYQLFKEDLEKILLRPIMLASWRQNNGELIVPDTSLWQSYRGALTYEQGILLRGNIKRRHRFEFAKGRYHHLGNTQSVPDHEADIHTSSIGTNPQDIMLAGNPRSSPKEEVKHDFSGNIAYSTSASNQVSAYEPRERLKLGVKKTRSQAPPTTIAANTGYPEPPSLGDNTFVFCPYCRLLLTKDSTSAPRWKKHISQDLNPYTCYLPSCNRELALFDTFIAWQEHITSEHQSRNGWQCLFCTSISGFTDRNEFLKHIAYSHHGVVSEDLLHNLPDMCQTYEAPILDRCHICSLSEGEWESQKKDRSIMRLKEESFMAHIGYCMHEFALWALPPQDNPERPGHLPSVSAEDGRSEGLSSSSESLIYSQDATFEPVLETTNIRSIAALQPPEELDSNSSKSAIISWAEQTPPGGDREFINGPDTFIGWCWDTFPVYRLDHADLEEFLRELFGDLDFSIQVHNDTYSFWIPRELGPRDRRTLGGRRWEDD